MIDIAVLAGVAIIVSSVVFVFGCVCHLFKKGPVFTTFENDIEGGYGNTVYSPSDASEISQVTFETIPDILTKTVTATALRPRISCTDGEIQKHSAKRVASYKAFPRSHLTYIKEMGIGWFGQVLVSEAYNMVTNSRSTRVIVKMMKDDANSTEQQLFLQDLSVYRELDHPNVLKLLGQCTEAPPLLAIMEYASLGNLKSYLRKECQIVKTMKDGTIRMNFLTDMAAGLECLHSNGYLHHDFACRNCVVMSNMVVKIGDYGVAEDHFREDYYDNGQDLLPIRWMSPESITLSNSIWQSTGFTKESNIWSFGIAMYEVMEYGQKPYNDLSDEQVLQNMIAPYPTKLCLPHTEDPVKSKLYMMMLTCFEDVSNRPSIEDLHAQLQQIQSEKDAADEAEFERKWAKISSKDARVVKVEVHASDIGLATALKHSVKDNTGNSTGTSFCNITESSPGSNSRKVSAADENSNSLQMIKNNGSDLSNRKQDRANSDNSFNNESLEIIRGEINGVGPTTMPLNLISDNLVIATPTRNIPMVHQFTSTPVITNKETDTKSKLSTQEISRESDSVSNSLKESNKNSENKIQSDDTEKQLDLNVSEDLCVQSDNSASNNVLPENQNEKIPNTDISNKTESDLTENPLKIQSEQNTDINGKQKENIDTCIKDKTDIVDSFIDFEKNFIESNPQMSYLTNGNDLLDDFLSKLTDEVEPENVSDQEEDEAEILKQLKLTLTGVLPGGTSTSENKEVNGISSPTADDMDIAREIYMSKGMSMPPSKYTSTRSLNTILEDELLSENEPEVKAKSPEFIEPLDDFSVSDSIQDSFEWDDYIGDELVGRVQNIEVSPRQSIDIDWTMEHDSSSQESETQNNSKIDENSSISKDTKSIGFNTPHSSSDSEVKNFRSPIDAISKSSKSPLGALSKGSESPMGAISKTSLSPMGAISKNSESPMSAVSKSPKSPLGAAAHSYVKHILSNRISNNSTNKDISFYSFSPNIDLDTSEHAQPTSSLTSASQYSLLDEWDL